MRSHRVIVSVGLDKFISISFLFRYQTDEFATGWFAENE
ncbi:hypothetical protein MFFC18_21980 [Mariniblastus fucicola]|uniref:Uncharacterized protein n=1 Tax=Mariniblastus fucicola TaxID=980251 RepID=A0A5B9P7L2_9BACT|nr:hypothetical protein MFFC18_21980 [Mariniblastus fucicola]